MAIELLDEDQALTRRDGRYDDGEGLWLIVRSHGHAASYFFDYNGELVGEKGWQHVSLGSRKKTPLRRARDRAILCRQLLKDGISPKQWRQHEQKAARQREGASLTVGEAIDGRDHPYFEGFRKWGVGRIWHKTRTIENKRTITDNYFKPARIWNMGVQEVEPEHAATLLDPIWRKKAPTGKRVQSFGYSLFKWLKLKKLYFDDNPFTGAKEAPMVELLGGPQPPSNRRENCEPNDLPMLMAHLRTPPHGGRCLHCRRVGRSQRDFG